MLTSSMLGHLLETRSENPLNPGYWFGLFDARLLALFRLCLGVVLLQDLWVRARGLGTFLTDDGVFPRNLEPRPWAWSLFNLSGEALPQKLLLTFGVLATLAFTLGYATRLAAFACWLFWVSIHRRVPIIHTGGDSMVDIFMLFAIFADLGGRWSLDATRRGPRVDVLALVPRFMQSIPALLYLYTARQKLGLGGRDWFFGPIIFKHMHLHGWIRPLGVWLGDHPSLCALFTGGTIIVELAMPVLRFLPFWVRASRTLSILCHVGLQLGILLTMKVGIFTNVMLAATLLWLPPEWLDSVGGWLARRGIAKRLRWTKANIAFYALGAFLYVATITTPVVPRHLPRFMPLLVDWAGLSLPITLFTRGAPSVRWETTGVLTDGSAIDPLPVAAPAADLSNDFFNSLWMQLPYRLEQFAPLGRFVCVRYDRNRDGPALRSWRLTSATRPPYSPGSTLPAEELKTLWEQACDAP